MFVREKELSNPSAESTLGIFYFIVTVSYLEQVSAFPTLSYAEYWRFISY